MSDRRGVALMMVLAATVLVGSLSLVALNAALIHSRLINDARWRVEGAVIVASALATARVGHAADLDTLSDGGVLTLPRIVRADGWSWLATATRSGSLIRLSIVATYLASDGSIFSARRASLMLAVDPADTVRVLARRARF